MLEPIRGRDIYICVFIVCMCIYPKTYGLSVHAVVYTYAGYDHRMIITWACILYFRVVCRTCLAGLHHQLLSCSDNFGEVLVPVHVECDGVVCMVCLDDIH